MEKAYKDMGMPVIGEPIPNRKRTKQRKNGAVPRPFHVARTADGSEGTVHLQAVTPDWAEQQRVKQALHHNERFLHKVFDVLHDGVMLLDSELRILRVNSWMEHKFAHRMPLIGKKCHEVLRDSVCSCPWCPALQTLRTGETHSEMIPYPSADAPAGCLELSSFPFRDASGSVAGVIEYVRDTTGMKRPAEALQDGADRYRALVETFDGYIYVCSQDHRIEFMNNRLIELTGYNAVGERCYEALHERSTPCSWCVSDRVSAGETVRREVRSPRGNRWYLTIYTPIYRPDGSVSTQAMVVDITQRKKVEEELLKAKKLEAIGVLAGGIAHDFNNLLTVILGSINLLQAELKSVDSCARKLSEAERACLRARDLTQRFITFSTGGAPFRKVASIRELIEGSAGLALTGSNIALDCSFPKDLWPVDIDEWQMRHVINDIVMNSKEAMPEGGTLTINARNVRMGAGEREIDLPVREADYVMISIADQGCGIPAENLDKIFDPYFSTKEMGPQRGMGLGLALAYSVIRKHDGYIRVESEPGAGTTVCIYLPAMADVADRPHEKLVEPPPIKWKILVMDDEEMLRRVTQMMLESRGCDVVTVRNGQEAIAAYNAARGMGQPFDAVILDLTVKGGMGGQETMRRLRELHPEVKAIVSSGYALDQSTSELLELGFSGMLTKPYTLTQLLDTLNSVLARDEYLQESAEE